MLAIIPARGGSKGLPGKNIKRMLDYPLIYYTIKEAKKSKYINRIIVSTDDKEIKEVALQLGAEVPFLRPDELASDTAKAIDNYIFTIEKLNKINIGVSPIKNFIVLQPTSPLRTVEDIDKAIKIFNDKNADSVISVVPSENPPSWYKKIDNDGVLKDFLDNIDNSLNRQEAEESYLPNGAIFVFKYDSLKSHYNYYTSKTYPYIMNQENSVDIDTQIDFDLAEIIMRRRLKSN